MAAEDLPFPDYVHGLLTSLFYGSRPRMESEVRVNALLDEAMTYSMMFEHREFRRNQLRRT